MVEGVNARAQSSMETEDTVRNECRHGKVVESVCKEFPDIGVTIFSEAFVVKSVTNNILKYNSREIMDACIYKYIYILHSYISMVDIYKVYMLIIRFVLVVKQ